MKVMIVVTHLLGTGHLARALTLARAFQETGHQVSLVSGGMPAPQLQMQGIDLLQLPAVRSDGVDFSRLLGPDGAEVDASYLSSRAQALIAHLHQFAPDVLITELFPFGRRILRNEFIALLQAAATLPARPLVCASIRDILAPPSKAKKAAFADEMVQAHYDAILVHAEEAITPLSLSWPVTDAITGKMHYTGFVAPPAAEPHPQDVGKDEIIVSAGGGDVGQHVFDAALAAAAHQDQTWRILIGGSGAAQRAQTLRRTAPAHVIIEPARPDFRSLLYHAKASVSLCGYNTALDILQSGCPAVFVPFDAGQEVEQSIRAEALARLPGISVVPSADLTAQSLRRALHAVTTAPPRAPAQEGFDGAAQTVRIVNALRGQMT